MLHYYWLPVTVVYSLLSTKHNKTLFLLYVSIRLGNNVLKQRINDTNCNTSSCVEKRHTEYIAIFWSPIFYPSLFFCFSRPTWNSWIVLVHIVLVTKWACCQILVCLFHFASHPAIAFCIHISNFSDWSMYFMVNQNGCNYNLILIK